MNKEEEKYAGGGDIVAEGRGEIDWAAENRRKTLATRGKARQDPRYESDPLFRYEVDAEELVEKIRDALNPKIKGGFDAYVDAAYAALIGGDMQLDAFSNFSERIKDIEDFEIKYNCKTYLDGGLKDLYSKLMHLTVKYWGEGRIDAKELASRVRSQLRAFLDGVHSVLRVAENNRATDNQE